MKPDFFFKFFKPFKIFNFFIIPQLGEGTFPLPPFVSRLVFEISGSTLDRLQKSQVAHILSKGRRGLAHVLPSIVVNRIGRLVGVVDISWVDSVVIFW